jgi:hypothetical protein
MYLTPGAWCLRRDRVRARAIEVRRPIRIAFRLARALARDALELPVPLVAVGQRLDEDSVACGGIAGHFSELGGDAIFFLDAGNLALGRRARGLIEAVRRACLGDDGWSNETYDA